MSTSNPIPVSTTTTATIPAPNAATTTAIPVQAVSTNATSPNLFESVLADAKGVEQQLLGPDYPYYKFIRTPDELGMSGSGG